MRIVSDSVNCTWVSNSTIQEANDGTQPSDQLFYCRYHSHGLGRAISLRTTARWNILVLLLALFDHRSGLDLLSSHGIQRAWRRWSGYPRHNCDHPGRHSLFPESARLVAELGVCLDHAR